MLLNGLKPHPFWEPVSEVWPHVQRSITDFFQRSPRSNGKKIPPQQSGEKSFNREEEPPIFSTFSVHASREKVSPQHSVSMQFISKKCWDTGHSRCPFYKFEGVFGHLYYMRSASFVPRKYSIVSFLHVSTESHSFEMSCHFLHPLNLSFTIVSFSRHPRPSEFKDSIIIYIWIFNLEEQIGQHSASSVFDNWSFQKGMVRKYWRPRCYGHISCGVSVSAGSVVVGPSERIAVALGMALRFMILLVFHKKTACRVIDRNRTGRPSGIQVPPEHTSLSPWVRYKTSSITTYSFTLPHMIDPLISDFHTSSTRNEKRREQREWRWSGNGLQSQKLLVL